MSDLDQPTPMWRSRDGRTLLMLYLTQIAVLAGAGVAFEVFFLR